MTRVRHSTRAAWISPTCPDGTRLAFHADFGLVQIPEDVVAFYREPHTEQHRRYEAELDRVTRDVWGAGGTMHDVMRAVPTVTDWLASETHQ